MKLLPFLLCFSLAINFVLEITHFTLDKDDFGFESYLCLNYGEIFDFKWFFYMIMVISWDFSRSIFTFEYSNFILVLIAGIDKILGNKCNWCNGYTYYLVLVLSFFWLFGYSEQRMHEIQYTIPVLI